MPSSVIVLGVRGLIAGAFVVAFSALSELLRPKSLAGVFAAAPSVAAASLLVTLVAAGEPAVWTAAVGMVGGAVAMVGACVVGIDAVRRLRALPGSVAAVGVWLAIAAGLYVAVLR
ncbi:MAG TPA: hypothetical protein VFC09_10995 [Candidatus Dormibacteraeota bacterium]|nr:hypothetical protein [Candidatus Dormibacteraeota bacterium]